jgi:biotin carboxyl carrier protein
MQIGLKLGQTHQLVEVHAEAGRYRVRFEDREHLVEVIPCDATGMVVVVDGVRHRLDLVHDGRDRLVAIGGEVYRFAPESAALGGHEVSNVAAPEISAPMPGKVIEVLVKPGDKVTAGSGLLVLEAMKMETRLVAEAAATVAEVRVAAGEMVEGGQVLIVLSYSEPESHSRSCGEAVEIRGET